MLAAQAGFDPRDMIGGWEEYALNAVDAYFPPEELSTHPSDASRIAELNHYLPAAMELFKKAPSINTAIIQTINWEGIRNNILQGWNRFRDYKNEHHSAPDPLKLAEHARFIRGDIYPRLKALEDAVLKSNNRTCFLPSKEIERTSPKRRAIRKRWQMC
ncbi:hypothetical protein IFR05_002067 [Cadophora sp. M221]|nr:hypothetical protein IFR05_002067 [Cadophora sp. M221]